MTFKEFLFSWGLRKSCPKCGGKVMEVGYVKDFFQRYACANDDCNWGKTW